MNEPTQQSIASTPTLSGGAHLADGGSSMSSAQGNALKFSAALWVIWGLVHFAAGVLSLSGTTQETVQNIADAVPDEDLALDYPDAAGAILDQHAWNLAWFGVVALIGAFFIWRRSRSAIWVTAMVGGLADLGYFLFLDLGGYVKFFPGTVMTIFSATAILLSGWVWLTSRPTSVVT